MAVRFRRGLRSCPSGISLVELLVSMIILGIITTLLVTAWTTLQRASATVVRTDNARATGRDALARISSELRASQPTMLPSPSGTGMPASETPLIGASPNSITFYSAFNSTAANQDGSGVDALRPTRLRLDTAAQTAPWNPACRTLYWERDMNTNGSFTDAADRSVILARNIANLQVVDSTNGTSYTPVFRYAYRSGATIDWTDNADDSLDVSTIVGIRVRLIVDAKMGGSPKYIDTTTTVRLRNASVD